MADRWSEYVYVEPQAPQYVESTLATSKLVQYDRKQVPTSRVRKYIEYVPVERYEETEDFVEYVQASVQPPSRAIRP
jgi:hypothetical protein